MKHDNWTYVNTVPVHHTSPQNLFRRPSLLLAPLLSAGPVGLPREPGSVTPVTATGLAVAVPPTHFLC